MRPATKSPGGMSSSGSAASELADVALESTLGPVAAYQPS